MPRELTHGRSSRQPSNSDPRFLQQGEVDEITLSTSIGNLARLSSAGVQETTYVGVLQLATRFKLADIGYQRVSEAVQNAQWSVTLNSVAYFGFGYRSFINHLADTVSGTNCIALCASLAEAHSEDLAARVIRSLWTVVGYPEVCQPSLPQFKCLVKACAGSFAQTSFTQTMKLILGPYRDVIQKGKSLEASDPDDIAKALKGIFDISKGYRLRITIVGGPECSFLAAVAHWLFDMKIQVEDSDGKTLFTSSAGSTDLQVRFVYKQDDSSWRTVISESTIVLNSSSDLLRNVPDARLLHIRTRVPWENCLTQTFGQGFKDLLSLPTVLGSFLGSYARIFQSLATGEVGAPDFPAVTFINFVEASFGKGFVASIGKIFPELENASLIDAANSRCWQSSEKVLSSIKEAVLSFKQQCSCRRCADQEAGSDSEVSNTRICLIALAGTLVELVCELASMDFEKDLLPTERGLYQIYAKHERAADNEPNTLLFNVLAPQKAHKRDKRDCSDEDDPKNETSRNPAEIMANAICIFTGHQPMLSKLENNRTAIAQDGICVYMDCLQAMTVKPELLRIVHVIPGHIGVGDRMFDSISDCAPRDLPALESAGVEPATESVDLSFPHNDSESLKLTALVDELGETGRLLMYYQISRSDGSRVFIAPGLITSLILQRSGLIKQDKLGCAHTPWVNTFLVKHGWKLNPSSLKDLESDPKPNGRSSNRKVFVWTHVKSEVARLLAIEIQRQGIESPLYYSRTILRRDECLQCAVQTASGLPFCSSQLEAPFDHVHIL